MKKRMNRKAALELSVGTIVVIVLAVSMLILGIVLVRSIMCGAIGLTGEVNEKVRGELNQLFGASTQGVKCIGSGGAVKMIPGQTNTITCLIRTPEIASYTFEVARVSSDSETYSAEKVESWLISKSFETTIAPGDEDPKKVLDLKVPDNAPEITVFINVNILKDGEPFSSQRLDFEISRTGFVRNTLC